MTAMCPDLRKWMRKQKKRQTRKLMQMLGLAKKK